MQESFRLVIYDNSGAEIERNQSFSTEDDMSGSVLKSALRSGASSPDPLASPKKQLVTGAQQYCDISSTDIGIEALAFLATARVLPVAPGLLNPSLLPADVLMELRQSGLSRQVLNMVKLSTPLNAK
jgi:hypothetical protein